MIGSAHSVIVLIILLYDAWLVTVVHRVGSRFLIVLMRDYDRSLIHEWRFDRSCGHDVFVELFRLFKDAQM